MRHIVSAACGLWIAFAATGQAQTYSASDPVAVIELYTSQGCSACPPADELLAQMADDPQVIMLALHVDYWDYIGWKDHFADPKFSARQKAYAKASGSRTVYTPQMIISGRERIEGHNPAEVDRLIRKQLANAGPVTLQLDRSGSKLHISAAANPPLNKPVRVQLVRYNPSETVDIERGENAGRKVTYRNIVTSWQNLGDWDGKSPLDMQAAVDGKQPVVVILQNPGPAEILAAARLK